VRGDQIGGVTPLELVRIRFGAEARLTPQVALRCWICSSCDDITSPLDYAFSSIFFGRRRASVDDLTASSC
jgi:hypothetical protein